MSLQDFLRYGRQLPHIQRELSLAVAVGVAAAFADGGIQRLIHEAEGWEYRPLEAERADALRAAGFEVS